MESDKKKSQMKKSRDYEKEILKILKNEKASMSIKGISEKLKVSRATVAKYLTKMEESGIILSQNIGQYKIWQYRNDASIIRKFTTTIYSSLLENLDYIIAEGAKKPWENVKKLGQFISRDVKMKDFVDIAELKSKLSQYNRRISINLDEFADLISEVFRIIERSSSGGLESIELLTKIEEHSIIILRVHPYEFINTPIHYHLLYAIIEEKLNENEILPRKISINVQDFNIERKTIDVKIEVFE